VVIAAITSCTTLEPIRMLGAGLVAKKAVERGLKTKPWVKTSLAPGSKVVMDYLREAGLVRTGGAGLPSGRLRMHHLHRKQRPVASLGRRSGGAREAGGRGRAERQPQLRGPHQRAGEGQLPGLAAAGGGLRAGRPRSISTSSASRLARSRRQPVYLRDIWPSAQEVRDLVAASVHARCSARNTRRSSKATRSGSPCRCPRAPCSHGARTPPT